MAGTNSPFSKMLIIILPGGVIHWVDGFCIAAITIPTIPITPLNVKKPPCKILFIVTVSLYAISIYVSRLVIANYYTSKNKNCKYKFYLVNYR